ncbi:HNH endonuclease signature motif containing protein [Micromonospora lutea]|uniref:HNH endonuclease n=1 Tax=Micromonospora lutea TaxID=419825 RepID=A0ABQ4ITN7_9ACTN|nr:HNH endonuclease signature motif containing protein [Micromonospora lutea]GIJ21242.1 HNH endonuclease [Micromonospora lutea]
MLEELARVEAETQSCVEAAVWAMPESSLTDALDAVHRLEQRLAAMKLALVRELDGRGTALAQGASSTAVWLRDKLRLSVPAARGLVDLAEALDHEAELSAALAAGQVDLAQTRVIAGVAALVRREADTEAAGRAVDLLVGWAGQFDPTVLRRLGSRILDHVAPEAAEAATGRALEAEAARAARDRHVTLSDLRDGRTRLTGSLAAETAALLRAAIDPLTAPSGPDDSRSSGQRRHDAVGDICRLALRSGDVPEHGADAAQIVVTTGYDVLTASLGPGTLDGGLTLTAETVRRLACDAAVLPAVLGGAGQILDVGRQRRLVSGPLRRALVLRDRGCAFPGCDRPPRWCEGHHLRHWSAGGNTSLANAVLLCRHHHRQVHHHGWQVRLAADGHPEFLPPTWFDPDQRPRRNRLRHPPAPANRRPLTSVPAGSTRSLPAGSTRSAPAGPPRSLPAGSFRSVPVGPRTRPAVAHAATVARTDGWRPDPAGRRRAARPSGRPAVQARPP